MEVNLVDRITSDPNYKLLKGRRSRLGWWLTAAIMVVYYGFILLIAFEKQVLATRIGSGVITWGIPVGFGVIIFTIAITAYYVVKANGEFDELTEKVRRGGLR